MSTAERDIDNLIKQSRGEAMPAPTVRPMAFEASSTIGKLAGALAKAQGAFEAIGKTREVKVQMKTGGSYTFAYAPLDEVLRAVRPAMASNGLALTQTVADGENCRTMTTTLLHESGEWMASTTTLPGQATTAQEFGSQITYMRRYAIVAILGVVADEDDDANAADGNSAQGETVPREGTTAPKAQGGGAKAPPPPALAPEPAKPANDVPPDEDLVECSKLMEEGHRKNNTYRCEWVPAGKQPRRREDQHIKLQEGRKALGLTDDDWRSDLRNLFSKETSKELSVDEADTLLAHMRKRWNQRKYKHPDDKAAAKQQRSTEVPEEMADLLSRVPGAQGVSPRADDLTALFGWRTVDASELETLKGKQCEGTLRMPTLGETVRCVRKDGHDGPHWCDLVNRA